MSSCSIKWCGKNSRTSSFTADGITFHRFPKSDDYREKWIQATKRENWIPSHFSVICSRHFTEDNFIRSVFKRRLKITAIPTLFLPVLTKEKDPLESESQHQGQTFIIVTTKSDQKVLDEPKPSSSKPVQTPINMPLFVPIAPKISNINEDIITQYTPIVKAIMKKQTIQKNENYDVVAMSKKILRKNGQLRKLRDNVRYLKRKIASLTDIINNKAKKKSKKSTKANKVNNNGVSCEELESESEKLNIDATVKSEPLDTKNASDDFEIIKEEINREL